MSTAAFLLKAAEFGLTLQQAAELVALLEPIRPAAAPAPVETRSAAAIRQQRYRDKHRGESVTGDVTRGVTGDVTDRNERDEKRNDVTPLARGLDKPLIVVVAGDDTAAAVTPEPADDWPQGDAHRHAQLLVSEASAPRRLDPSRMPGLVTTTGRLAAWKRDGASWRHDVVPIVTTLARKTGPPISTWKFFDAAIAQSVADNRQALEIPEGRTAHGNAPRHPAQPAANGRAERRSAWADVLADEQRSAAG